MDTANRLTELEPGVSKRTYQGRISILPPLGGGEVEESEIMYIYIKYLYQTDMSMYICMSGAFSELKTELKMEGK